MKTFRILFVLCIMLGFSVPAQSQGKQVERPFKGSFYSVVLETIDNGTRELLSITGNATHIGLVISQMTFDKPPAPHYLEGIIRAANGDYFNFHCSPTMTITDLPTLSGSMSGTVFISGGTGRFTGCFGECLMTGTFSMGQDWAKWTVEGTIIY